MKNSDNYIINIADVEPLTRDLFIREGFDEANASALARNIALAEQYGSYSHGLFRLPGYLASLKSGKVRGNARPTVEQVTSAVIRVDGDSGYAPISHDVLVDPLIKTVHSSGVALAAVVNTHHFSALWIEVERLARLGLIAIACTSYKPAMPAQGGRKPVFGTNPLAFACPREKGEPFVFDQASAMMARGDVMRAAEAGILLSEGVGLGPDGVPTNDPRLILKGCLVPFGGHKGASIALMVELLAGPLIGEVLSIEAAARDQVDGGPPRGGEFILAFDPVKIRGDYNFPTHAEILFQEIASDLNATLPGEGRMKRRNEVVKKGVTIPSRIMALLQEK
jgi:delta1-piperideine-2-carboxylate reductase